jgi:rfaE bifunctional protein nucleotidyltransferase chain/domain
MITFANKSLLNMAIIEHITSKIIPIDCIDTHLKQWRSGGKKIVFTNGCFDILHRGHVEYLAQAAALGDVLVVGINSDNSVRRIKGNERPLQDQSSRSLVLAAIGFVSCVIIFDDDTPYKLIKIVRPNVLVKGADYSIEQIVGSDIVRSCGGNVVTIALTDGYSTSKVVEKMKR